MKFPAIPNLPDGVTIKRSEYDDDMLQSGPYTAECGSYTSLDWSISDPRTDAEGVLCVESLEDVQALRHLLEAIEIMKSVPREPWVWRGLP